MNKVKLVPFDAARYLTDNASQTELINDAFESGETAYITAALGAVARARGMTAVSDEAGIARQSLYRALSKNGNPTLDTVTKVIDALGMRLSVKSAA